MTLLAYDGTAFRGWARQPNLRTVQGTLEAAIARILGGDPRLVVAGRTDAGVHASGQVAHLDLTDAQQQRLQSARNPDPTALAARLTPGDRHGPAAPITQGVGQEIGEHLLDAELVPDAGHLGGRVHHHDEAERLRLAGLDQQVVFATHDLEFARDAERVVVVDRGQVAYDGPPAQAVEAYRRLMGVP